MLHVRQGYNSSVPIIINESVMAKCHHTILDVLGPNSIPTENSRDQNIQLTSVAFRLDLRLYSEWNEVLHWETEHFQLLLSLAPSYQSWVSKKRVGDLVFSTLKIKLGTYEGTWQILSPNCNNFLLNSWVN